MSRPPEPDGRRPLGEPTGRRDDPPWYTRRVEVVLYLLAAVTYVGFGMFHKFLLNWIIGPVWLVTWLWLVPVIVDRVRGAKDPAS
jgi:hypothetical protein